jgi:predicted transcriptional regulator
MIVKRVAEVAEFFGKTPRTVRNWIRAGMPKLSGGAGYDLQQVEDWLRSVKYLGGFRGAEADLKAASLFESSVMHLRRGLEQLCRAYVSVRGKTRERLIARALRDIVHGVMRQESFL